MLPLHLLTKAYVSGPSVPTPPTPLRALPAGSVPCCGTGVIFRRDILVSIGGQSYGSITEDFNSAMSLMAAGFSSMYLNERLMFGMVPEDIGGGTAGWAGRCPANSRG